MRLENVFHVALHYTGLSNSKKMKGKVHLPWQPHCGSCGGHARGTSMRVPAGQSPFFTVCCNAAMQSSRPWIRKPGSFRYTLPAQSILAASATAVAEDADRSGRSWIKIVQCSVGLLRIDNAIVLRGEVGEGGGGVAAACLDPWG